MFHTKGSYSKIAGAYISLLSAVSFPSCVGIVPLRLLGPRLLRRGEKALARMKITWEGQHTHNRDGLPLMQPYWLKDREVERAGCEQLKRVPPRSMSCMHAELVGEWQWKVAHRYVSVLLSSASCVGIVPVSPWFIMSLHGGGPCTCMAAAMLDAWPRSEGSGV